MATSKNRTTHKAKAAAEPKPAAKATVAASALIPAPGKRVPGEPVVIGNSTLTQIHDKTGLTLSYLSRVFRARKVPAIRTLNVIAQAAGVSPGTLLDALNGLEPPAKTKARARARARVKGAKTAKGKKTTPKATVKAKAKAKTPAERRSGADRRARDRRVNGRASGKLGRTSGSRSEARTGRPVGRAARGQRKAAKLVQPVLPSFDAVADLAAGQ